MTLLLDINRELFAEVVHIQAMQQKHKQSEEEAASSGFPEGVEEIERRKMELQKLARTQSEYVTVPYEVPNIC